MSTVIYLHGFLSSPQSKKAVQLGEWLAIHRPEIDFICPELSSYPQQAIGSLEELMCSYHDSSPMLVGSSLGGYWATWLAERYNLAAVVINPLVDPGVLQCKYVGVPIQNYHTGEAYLFSDDDMGALSSVEVSTIENPDRFWLMVQTKDESLDYRLAIKKYVGSRQLVEEGGNHSFEDFPRWIPNAMKFLEGSAVRLEGS